MESRSLLPDLDSVLDDDPSGCEMLVALLIGSDLSLRPQAESLFDFANRTQPALFSLALSRVISSSVIDIRMHAAIRLGQVLTQLVGSSSSFLFCVLDETTRDTIKSSLLNVLRNELSKPNLEIIRDTIFAIYSTGGWPELLPYIFPFTLKCTDSYNDLLLISLLYICKKIAQHLSQNPEILMPHLVIFREAVLECLKKEHWGSNSNSNVKLAAFSASVSFLEVIPVQNDMSEDLILLMKMLIELLKLEISSTIVEALQLLTDLVKVKFAIFEKHLEKIVRLMMKVVMTAHFKYGVRSLAFDLLRVLGEKKPTVSIDENFIRRLYVILIRKFLEEMEADQNWDEDEDENEFEDEFEYGNEDEEEDEDDDLEIIHSKVLKKFLHKLSLSIGGEIIFPLLIEFIQGLSVSYTWQFRYAALFVISYGFEDCNDEEMIRNIVIMILDTLHWDPHHRVRWAAIFACVELAKLSWDEMQQKDATHFAFMSEKIRVMMIVANLEQMVLILLDSFHDSHQRVRWAAIKALGQLSLRLSPILQIRYHHLCVPALVAVMDDFQCFRAQVLAASAVLNFMEYGRTCAALLKYFEALGSKFEAFLQALAASAFLNFMEYGHTCADLLKYFEALGSKFEAFLQVYPMNVIKTPRSNLVSGQIFPAVEELRNE